MQRRFRRDKRTQDWLLARRLRQKEKRRGARSSVMAMNGEPGSVPLEGTGDIACIVTVVIDQSTDTLSPILDLINSSPFSIRSVHLNPINGKLSVDVHLRLVVGSEQDFYRLVARLTRLQGVLSIDHHHPTAPHPRGLTCPEVAN